MDVASCPPVLDRRAKEAAAAGAAPGARSVEPDSAGLLSETLAAQHEVWVGRASAASTRHGLARYQVVPEGHVRPLEPGQLRQSQLEELVAHGFGAFKVVDDAEAGRRPLDRDEMTDAEFDRLVAAWLGIATGKGLQLRSDKPGDAAAFKTMLGRGLADSPTLRSLVSELGENREAAAPVALALGRRQHGVLLDSYASKAVDLDDLGALPSAYELAPGSDAVTREEQIAHILAERRMAARLQAARPIGDAQVFNQAHSYGMRSQNAFRAERGQVDVIDALSHSRTGRPGAAVAEYKLADGTSETLETSGYGTIDAIHGPR